MATDQGQRVWPFSCGTQSMDWDQSNCCTCRRDPEICEVSVALMVACFDDGTVSPEIAKRMGYTDYGWKGGVPRYGWPCLEHDPPFENLEEWANG